eukprot:Colp12_sorted_trinity150504_noHs@29120
MYAATASAFTTQTNTSPSTPASGSGLKLGIMHLGKAAGKHKFMLLDASDIDFVKRFCFQAKLDIDKDGNGAHVYAFAYIPPDSKLDGSDYEPDDITCCGYFHDLLWLFRKGPITPGYRVSHKNGITVDNRLVNLELSKIDAVPSKECDPEAERKREQSCSLYRAALMQYPFSADSEQENSTTIVLDADGESSVDDGESSPFFECHYPPCCKMESYVKEFNICGRCRKARYCSSRCQNNDWKLHKKDCKETDACEEELCGLSR